MHKVARLCLTLAAGCGASAPSTSPKAPPARPTRSLCTLSNTDTARCSAPDLELVLPFSARQVVGRLLGGAYVLGDGALARFDRKGRLSGIFESDFRELIALGAYICGVSGEDGAVWCARDHHNDAGCRNAVMGDWFELPFRVLGSLKAFDAPGRECVYDARHPERCERVRSTCNTLCVAYPTCGPLRCIDPCASEALSGGESDGEENFSNRSRGGDVST